MTKAISFIKMHGIGNDYIYIDTFKQSVTNPSEAAKKMSFRHFGIGADGLVLIAKSEKADVKMSMYNADGSQSENCGNALRCVAKYLFDEGIHKNNPIHIETLSGVYLLHVFPNELGKAENIKVNLGPPALLASDVSKRFTDERKINHSFDFGFASFYGTLVSFGNPHIVIFTENTDAVPIEIWGPQIENHPLFSERINVEFVEIINRNEVIQRTWERGTGETWACGTGAAAVCVAGVLTDKTDSKLKIHLKGGDLDMEWQGEEHPLYMTGPATEVFRGNIEL